MYKEIRALPYEGVMFDITDEQHKFLQKFLPGYGIRYDDRSKMWTGKINLVWRESRYRYVRYSCSYPTYKFSDFFEKVETNYLIFN